MNQYFQIKNDIRGALTHSALLAVVLGIIAIGIVGAGWFMFDRVSNGNLPPTSPGSINPPAMPPEPPREVFSYSSITGEGVNTESLDVSSCALNPQVLLVKIGSTFQAENKSDAEVSLFFSKILKPRNNTIVGPAVAVVPPNSSKEVKINFEDGPGRYSYDCMSSVKNSPGILQVIK